MAKQPGLILSALKSRLADGKIAPVYLISGGERFLADEAVRSITEAVRSASGGCSRTLYQGNEADLATVLDDVRTRDLFCPARLVIVSPADQFVQKYAPKLATYLAAPMPGACLVLVLNNKADGRKKLTREMAQAGGLVACGRLYPRDIVPWIMARVSAMGRRIKSPAAAMLGDFLGTDLAAIAGELDKLVVYLADRKTITADDVEAVALRDRSRVIFELTDAIGRKDPGQVLTTLNGLLGQGEKPGGILYRVSRHMRQLWAAKELISNGRNDRAAAQELGVRYFVEQFLAQVQTFTTGELRGSCSALARCEARLKSSGIDDDRILLETTFLRLVRRRAKRARAAV